MADESQSQYNYCLAGANGAVGMVLGSVFLPGDHEYSEQEIQDVEQEIAKECNVPRIKIVLVE